MKKDNRITTYNSKDVTFAENLESMRLEAEFAKKHRHDTDEELIRYLRGVAKKLGHIPKKHEVLGYALIKSRFEKIKRKSLSSSGRCRKLTIL